MFFIILGVLLSVWLKIKKKTVESYLVVWAAVLCLLGTFGVIDSLYCTEDSTTRQSTNFRIAPVSNNQYFEIAENQNLIIRFYMELENGTYQIKSVDTREDEVVIEQLENGELPMVEIQQEQPITRIIRKPNMWFDFLGYIILYKYDIGDELPKEDLVGNQYPPKTTYIVHVPQLSMVQNG